MQFKQRKKLRRQREISINFIIGERTVKFRDVVRVKVANQSELDAVDEFRMSNEFFPMIVCVAPVHFKTSIYP
jgi:hypothetical protein